jgi:NADPH:quinone reductase-like Zn-dependent oxidoreductase
VRAQVQRGFGGPDVVAVEDLAEPIPGDDEVLIAVRACGLNRLDLLQREAALVRGFSLPHVAGMDVAGVVVARGSGVGNGVGADDDLTGAPSIGQAVLVDPVSTCGVCDRCTSGRSPYCENLRTIGSTRHGGFAEYVAVPASKCHPIPDGMSFVEAACLPVAYMTAWHALVTAGRVRPGEVVLVNAAGSGVSTAIVQFAVAAGATVIGTAGGPAKVARAIEIGCADAVDHYADDVAERVMAITSGRGVDLVVDHVGPALFDASIRSLAIEGRMVFCGTTTGTTAEVNLPSIYHWGRTLIGAGGYRAEEFSDMLHAVDVDGLRPIVDSVWPFDRLADAQACMADGSFFGKLVVTFEADR